MTNNNKQTVRILFVFRPAAMSKRTQQQRQQQQKSFDDIRAEMAAYEKNHPEAAAKLADDFYRQVLVPIVTVPTGTSREWERIALNEEGIAMHSTQGGRKLPSK